MLKAEVLLDRARFSTGTIDGIDGENFRKALSAYQAQSGLKPTGQLDQPTWERLTSADAAPVIVERQITPDDVKGPFLKRLPAKLEEQAQLKHLGYTGVEEGLAEQVHASVGLLKALNRGARWTKAGTIILTPQVVVKLRSR